MSWAKHHCKLMCLVYKIPFKTFWVTSHLISNCGPGEPTLCSHCCQWVFAAHEIRNENQLWLWKITPNLNLSYTATVCTSFSGCPPSGSQRLICRLAGAIGNREDDLCFMCRDSCCSDAVAVLHSQPLQRALHCFPPKCRQVSAGAKGRDYLVMALCLQQNGNTPGEQRI